MKKLLATSALTLALAGGTLGVASVAGASTTTSSPSASAPSAHQGHGTGWLKAHRRAVRQVVVVVSASTIGVTNQQLVTELKSGQSIADVAAQHNVTSQTVVDALVKAADAKVQTAVTDGKLTAAHAQVIEGRLPALANKVVAHVFGHHAGTTTPAPAAS